MATEIAWSLWCLPPDRVGAEQDRGRSHDTWRPRSRSHCASRENTATGEDEW